MASYPKKAHMRQVAKLEVENSSKTARRRLGRAVSIQPV